MALRKRPGLTDGCPLLGLRPQMTIAWVIALASTALLNSPAWAQPDRDKDPLSFDRNIGGLLNRYCYRCHNEDDANGEVDLAKDKNPRLIFDNAVVWRRALQQIESEQMPPEDVKQPTREERELIVRFLRETLDRLDCDGEIDPGNPMVRRLNRVEYDRSIRFLTGLDLDIAKSFPPDATSYGFENIAASLTLTPRQVEQYYDAAQKVVASLLQSKDVPAGDEDEPAGYARVFFANASEVGSQRGAAEKVMERFAMRAFRRPVEADWLAKLMKIYDRARDQGKEHDLAIGDMITAVLISPRFLMRYENNQPDNDGIYRVDDFELASRLSFFLWSAPPDDRLLELAGQGGLHEPARLNEQIDRMLDDPRSVALVEQFFAPWLQFNGVRDHKPDEKAFPGFGDELHVAIGQEPAMMIAEMIREDRPITDLIDSNYTYVNRSLAVHYGIEGVSGEAMQRVELVDRRRGGVLTTAALLMAQADPARTNVPRRGNFIAAAILGTPAPPPPPDVPELTEPEGSDRPLTLRERLEQHRSDAQCASCHAKIDPLGFGFENFDAIGRWRDEEVGKPIDASGELPTGESFKDVVELKDILVKRKDEFAKTLTTQLMIYALGRGPIAKDACVVEEVLEAARQNDYRFRTFVKAIVQSGPFQYRRNPEY
jgi:hypothetical protein